MTTSFASIIRGWAADQPDAPALTVVAGGVREKSWTYGELDAASNRVAQALRAAGVVAGDRVAHLGRNRAGYVGLLYGASKVRATLVGLNWRLTAAELEPLLADASPRVIVADDEFRATLDAAGAGLSPAVVRGDGSPIRRPLRPVCRAPSAKCGRAATNRWSGT
jgi:acyl-CoA synthetase (AMP-forming)/AMP-acid ligase II